MNNLQLFQVHRLPNFWNYKKLKLKSYLYPKVPCKNSEVSVWRYILIATTQQIEIKYL